MQHLHSAPVATGSEDHRCPECGTPAGPDPPPRPRWVRTAPWLLTLLVLAALVVISVVRIVRYSNTGAAADPYRRFVEPPIDQETLRAIAAGDEPAPHDLIDRFLEHLPPKLIEPPGEQHLHVELRPPSGSVQSSLDVGRPLRWLIVRDRERFTDVFRRVPETLPGWIPASGASEWRWMQGRLLRSRGSSSMFLSPAALAVPVLLIVIAGVHAGRVQRWMIRRRPSHRAVLGIRRWPLITMLLVTNALVTWTVLDVDRTSSRSTDSFSMPGQPSTHRAPLTAGALRALHGEADGAQVVAEAIADVLASAPNPEPHPFDALVPLERYVLCIGFQLDEVPHHSGWYCGWPVVLLGYNAVRGELTVDGVQQAVVWPPRETRWWWGWDRLMLRTGSRAPSDSVDVLTIDFHGLAALLVVALVTWWLARGCSLVAMRHLRRRRARLGKCLACGYLMKAGGEDEGAAGDADHAE